MAWSRIHRIRYNQEKPVHEVTISQPFYLSKYEVTQGQWEKIMGNNPSRFTGEPTRPVEQVSWEDVQQFIKKLNKQEKEKGVTYRLPTEAEWEYAARAGATTAYSFGDDPAQLDAYAWCRNNSEGTTHSVGQKQQNRRGLYDMHGNVWEWVQDWYGTYPAVAVTDPQGPDTDSYRVIRGGGWYGAAGDCRSANRYYAGPGDRDDYLGFRLLRTVR
jgi:formylglycine-generating enzyme required for sulfatase activity